MRIENSVRMNDYEIVFNIHFCPGPPRTPVLIDPFRIDYQDNGL